MAFKDIQQEPSFSDSPENILLDLPRRKIPGVLYHQGEMLKAYVSKSVEVSDVALQLPTGSGKTLVGLLIAEWRRRKFKEKVIYLCPTRQLVNQVVEQANQHYGLSVIGFTGSMSKYDPASKAAYKSAETIAITTYSSLFNINSFFAEPDIIIVDDAHAAENYIASLWTVRVSREDSSHSALHAGLCGLLESVLSSTDHAKLVGLWESLTDLAWTDKIPTPRFMEIADEFRSIVDTHVETLDIRYPWSFVRDHLDSCHVYMSPKDILIRPLIPPTWTHKPFNDAKQRIFMSATLGAGGDLERLTGRKHILRLPIPEGWQRQGIGRRFFMFLDKSLKPDEAKVLRLQLMKSAGRSLVLVPNEIVRSKVTAEIGTSFQIFGADDIENSKRPFVESKDAVAIIVNRYDGIDFPGDDCRLLFIDGLPKATNTQERFLMSKMGANLLFNERIQTRVLQAIGRCTRALQDFSAVVVSNEELSDYLTHPKRLSHLHPEIQAEISFGEKQSIGSTIPTYQENFEIFMANGKAWEEANNQILNLRAKVEQKPFPAIDELQSIVEDEIEFQSSLWNSDYQAAMSFAEKVLGKLTNPDLRGYRALWYYLAGSAAWLSSVSPSDSIIVKAQTLFREAKKAAPTIPWLISLSKYQKEGDGNVEDKSVLLNQVERLEFMLSKLGTTHHQKYDVREKEILDSILGSAKFENGQRLLGELLGFESKKVETDASPDPWWISGDFCFVFEDHAGASADSILDTRKARQVATHPNWISDKVEKSSDMKILPVLISPVKKAKSGAMPHLKNVALWNLDDFRSWSRTALTAVRELRRSFVEPGDLIWRADAVKVFEENHLDAQSLYRQLTKRLASQNLQEVA